MKISIIGAGYVGLVTGACFAEMGHDVLCLDIDKKKIESLQKGKVPFFEPGLEEMVKRNVCEKRLSFTSDYACAISEREVSFLALPTPSRADGSCNTDFLEAAIKDLAPHLCRYQVLVIKSTVPIGTHARIKNLLQEALAKEAKEKRRSPLVKFDLISNPEFLKEGNAVADCMKPDRIIIGSDSEKASKILKELYASFMLHHSCWMEMDPRSAEMTKYAANAMLASRISFMNEMAEICRCTGANIHEVRRGIGSDPRIGYSFLYAGMGYGGSCFPKDVRALCRMAKEKGFSPLLLESIDAVNERQKRLLAQKLLHYFSRKGGLKGKTIAVWGLSFKPETDDIREAPSLTFIECLQRKGASLRLFDPVAMKNARFHLKDHQGISWCKDPFHAAQGADAIALITEWKQFRNIDFHSLRKIMRGFAFFDGRNQYLFNEMKEKGFDYIGIGVPDFFTESENHES